jgi:hypothetical protein
MTQLPSSVSTARDLANSAADAHKEAWDELQLKAHPNLIDLEKWLAVRTAFYCAQEAFESRLREFLASPFSK